MLPSKMGIGRGKKEAAVRPIERTLQFMAAAAVITPWPAVAQRKARETIRLAQKKQIKLGMFRRMLCPACSAPQIAGDTVDFKHAKAPCGYGVAATCLVCRRTRFLPMRGRPRTSNGSSELYSVGDTAMHGPNYS